MDIDKYYKILGLDEDASENEIRRKYRQLAKKLHPDHNTSHNAQEQFILVNEAYVGILEYRKNEKEYRPTIRKEQSKEERLKNARERYYEQLRKEEIENERFFNVLTSGKRWFFVKTVAVVGLVLSLISIADYFLPSHYEKDKVVMYKLAGNQLKSGNNDGLQAAIMTENGYKIYLKDLRYSLYGQHQDILIEKSWLLHDVVNVFSNQKVRFERFEVGFGLYFFRPLFIILMLLPSILLFYRQRKIYFTIVWYLSFYVSSVVIVAHGVLGGHIWHLVTLGLM